MKKLFVFIVGVFLVFSNTQIIYAKCTKEVTKGMVVKNEVISAGETQIVWNGGETKNVTVERGGRQLVYDGGKAFSTKIKALGFQYVGNGGWAGQTTIEERGLQIVDGEAPETVISGGVQIVKGMTLGSRIENSGMAIVCRSGASIDTIIDDGIQHINGFCFSSIGRNFKLNKNGIRNVYGTTYVFYKEDPDLWCIKIGE